MQTQKPKTVLAVDDDEGILVILKKILQNAGFSVHTATSPAFAREILKQGPPHLIISDLNMPGEDGYAFIQSVREQKVLRDIPVIVLSAVNEFTEVKRAVALGISDYAIKPIQAPMILMKIRKALHGKDFASWKAPKGKGPEVSVGLDVEVVELGEVGYRISGPLKLTAGQDISLEVKEFNELGLKAFVQRPSLQAKSYQAGGQFLSDVTFIGISEQGSSTIRQFVRKVRK